MQTKAFVVRFLAPGIENTDAKGKKKKSYFLETLFIFVQ